MKYPERLSPERLFFLSKEDRAIYESEWANVPEEINDAQAYIKVHSANDEVVDEQIQQLYKDVFSDIISEEDFKEYKKSIDEDLKFYFNEITQLSVNEGQPGADHYRWLLGTSGIGKWFIAGLGLLGSGIALLATSIRDRIAMAKLKTLMNKATERIDNGLFKRRSFISKLFKLKNHGEHNVACFRFIQENADRNMALGVMQAAKKLGYFAPGQMQMIASGAMPQEGGGLSEFNKNIISKLNFIVPEPPETVDIIPTNKNNPYED